MKYIPEDSNAIYFVEEISNISFVFIKINGHRIIKLTNKSKFKSFE